MKSTILDAVKDAMRAREAERLGTLRMLTAAIKQIEIDDGVLLNDNDAGVVAVIRKMIKQRGEASAQ